MVSDISEQKKLEAQFRRSEQMVSMGSVAAGVAHEIEASVGLVGNEVRHKAGLHGS